MILRQNTIDPLELPDELKPILARFFRTQAKKGVRIQRDIVYPFEKAKLVFTHDIYPHPLTDGKWYADVLDHLSFYSNDFTTGRKVIATIDGNDTPKQGEPALSIKSKSRRCYFFLAPELNSKLDIIKRFTSSRPRFYLFNNTNIVSMIVQGECVFDFLNNERSFAGKALTTTERFRMIISVIHACMEFHMRSVCNREITVKDIVYDKQTNQTQMLSFRLAKMMNDASMGCGGKAHSGYGAPEEFISQSTNSLITDEDHKKRNSIISKAGLPADIFMLGYVSINIWRHIFSNHSENSLFIDFILQRERMGWKVESNLFTKIIDLSHDEQEAIKYLSSLLLTPKNPDKRPVIEECFYRYQQLYLNHKLLSIDDQEVQSRMMAANMLAHALHVELHTIACRSILLNDCKAKIARFLLDPKQPFSLFKSKLVKNNKSYLSAIILAKLQELDPVLNVPENASIADFLLKLESLANVDKLKEATIKYIGALEDHPDAIAEFVDYCDLRCLFDIESTDVLLQKVKQIFEHHAAMLALLKQHADQFSAELQDIKFQLANDALTLDTVVAQSSHIERKFGKLQIAVPQAVRKFNMN